jgi:hypothetical protein
LNVCARAHQNRTCSVEVKDIQGRVVDRVIMESDGDCPDGENANSTCGCVSSEMCSASESNGFFALPGDVFFIGLVASDDCACQFDNLCLEHLNSTEMSLSWGNLTDFIADERAKDGENHSTSSLSHADIGSAGMGSAGVIALVVGCVAGATLIAVGVAVAIHRRRRRNAEQPQLPVPAHVANLSSRAIASPNALEMANVPAVTNLQQMSPMGGRKELGEEGLP